MSKSLIAVIGLVALIGSAAQAAEPAKRRLNTVTFTQTISPSSATPRTEQATTDTGISLGSWSKVDGLATSWDVAESRGPTKTLLFTLLTTRPAPPPNVRAFRSRMERVMSAKGSGNDIAVEGITLGHEGFHRVK